MGQLESRSDRHEKTIVLREQIFAYAEVLDGMPTGGLGSALAVNVVGGFALELSLKLFYMSFFEDGPPRTHNLETLWQGMPLEWRHEIDREYRKDPRSKRDFFVFGIQRAANQPDKPEQLDGSGFANADSLFNGMREAFEEARYFHEQVEIANWSFLLSPKEQMQAMIDVLTAFYQHVLNAALTWQPPVPDQDALNPQSD